MPRHVLEFIWSYELWSFGVIKVLEKNVFYLANFKGATNILLSISGINFRLF
jgi:hypothetical protein